MMPNKWCGLRPAKFIGVVIIILSLNWLFLGLGVIYSLLIPIGTSIVQLIIGTTMIIKGKSSPNTQGSSDHQSDSRGDNHSIQSIVKADSPHKKECQRCYGDASANNVDNNADSFHVNVFKNGGKL